MATPEPERMATAEALERLAAAHVLFFVAIAACALASLVASGGMGPLVLPAAALVTALGLRLLNGSSPRIWATVLVAAAIHVAAGFLAAAFPDNSWDGLAYHQEAVLRLADGWNPLVESSARYGRGNELYLDHYPNGSWTAAAAVLLTTGHLEAGKLFNATLMIAAAAQTSAALLRLTTLPIAATAALGALAALNPVFVYQGLTFYLDNLVASSLTILVAALAAFVASGRRQLLETAILAACVAILVKLTGLVYVTLAFGIAAPMAWWWHSRERAVRMGGAAAAAVVLGAGILGFTPYVRNVLDHGDPLYPARPVYGLVDTVFQIPANLRERDRVTRFLISNFSQSETVRNPRSTRLKFPLWVAPVERRGLYSADIEAGGFGPLFGAMLLAAAVGAVGLLRRPSMRRPAAIAGTVAMGLALSLFLHQEGWWARYAPQAWLLPFVLAVPGLAGARRSLSWCMGVSVAALAVLNLSVVAANVGWRQAKYALDTRRTLQEMSAAQPVDVYLGGFGALRQRMHEAGVEFRLHEEATMRDTSARLIPAPGQQAFWQPSRMSLR